MPGWPSCTTARSRGEASSSAPATRPSRSSATRRSSATTPVRSIRSATCTRARCASSRSRSACPRPIVRKAPSADLWPGQTDELEGGFTYPLLDRLLFWRVDKRRSTEELAELGFDPSLVERVDRLVAGGRVQAAGPADRQARATNGRRGLPVSASPARFLGQVSRAGHPVSDADAGHGRDPVRRCDADRQPRPTSRCGPSRRCASSRSSPRRTRGTPSGSCSATRPGRPPTSHHARSGPDALATLLQHLRDGEDLALVTDAGTPGERSRGGPRGGLERRGGGRVVPIPGVSAVLAAVVAAGVVGPRWSFEGFLPRTGRDRRERLARIAADERATIVYEAPNRVAGTLRDLAAACGADRTPPSAAS